MTVPTTILYDIEDERSRTSEIWGHKPDWFDPQWPAALAGKTEQAMRARLYTKPASLRKELIQIAALAIAWAEAHDDEYGWPGDEAIAPSERTPAREEADDCAHKRAVNSSDKGWRCLDCNAKLPS